MQIIHTFVIILMWQLKGETGEHNILLPITNELSEQYKNSKADQDFGYDDV